MNDIPAGIRLFEDDTTLYIIVENPNDAATIINIDLNKIKNWAKLRLVTFNPNKIEAMLLSRKRNRPDHPTLYFDGTGIQELTSHKHLGIYFSQKLASTHTFYNRQSSVSFKPSQE